jgi:hypothetical protein
MNALWFSRHEPTNRQREEIALLGFSLIAMRWGLEMGSTEINSDTSLDALMEDLRDRAEEVDARAVFGVFPVPIQSKLHGSGDEGNCPCFGAWNIRRSSDGGPPTFAHKCFLQVGFLF